MISVPTERPPIIVTASDPKSESETSGIIPRIVVNDAIITGKSRDLLLSMRACVGSLPRVICNDISSMSTMPFFIIIPMRPSMPTMATNPKSLPESNTDGNTPTTTSGMQQKMIAGRRRSLNSNIRMSSIITIDNGNPLNKYFVD